MPLPFPPPSEAFPLFFLLLSLFFVCSFAVFSFPDNGIIGEPFVHCGGNFIEARFDTQNPFTGIVFVEGHLTDPQCRSSASIDATDRSARNAQIRLHFNTCGIKQIKKIDPKGVFLSIRLVVSFHRHYLSKFDRIFDLRCFYMEMEHELEKQLIVKMDSPLVHSKQVTMPNCSYEVLSGGPNGSPVYYAKVGQMVYHKWTCKAQENDQKFCMIVHSCVVDDGNCDTVELIDAQGCARDKYLLQNLEYVSDLMVGKEAHVYKYADRERLLDYLNYLNN